MTNKSLQPLDDLLVDLFEPEELSQLIEYTFGRPLLTELPARHGSSRQYFSDVVRLLSRRGMIEPSLFRALTHVRPHRVREIDAVAHHFGLPSAAVHVEAARPGKTVGAAQSAPRGELVETLERHLLERERMPWSDPGRALVEKRIADIIAVLRPSEPYAPGVVVAGTRLIEQIGSGNFGTVWKAEDVRSKTLVATKIFHVDKLGEGIMLWRFRRSIRALSILGNRRDAPPSVPKLVQVAPDALAFSMPLFSEGSLERIDRRGWTRDTKIDKFLVICAAVQFAHKLGIIHRDIKPSNVLFDSDLRPVLIDYDIADIRFVTQLSLARGSLGTPIFAAPEQLEHSEQADERSDVYSLGRLLYYMLLEHSPGYQIERDPELSNLSGEPAPLVAVVRKATQWDPRKRYASVEQLIRDVEQYKTGAAAIRARLRSMYRQVRMHAALITTCAVIFVGIAAIAIERAKVAREREYTIRRHEANSRLVAKLATETQHELDIWHTLREQMEAVVHELRSLNVSAMPTEQKLKMFRTLTAKIDKIQRQSEQREAEIQRIVADIGKTTAELDRTRDELRRGSGSELEAVVPTPDLAPTFPVTPQLDAPSLPIPEPQPEETGAEASAPTVAEQQPRSAVETPPTAIVGVPAPAKNTKKPRRTPRETRTSNDTFHKIVDRLAFERRVRVCAGRGADSKRIQYNVLVAVQESGKASVTSINPYAGTQISACIESELKAREFPAAKELKKYQIKIDI